MCFLLSAPWHSCTESNTESADVWVETSEALWKDCMVVKTHRDIKKTSYKWASFIRTLSIQRDAETVLDTCESLTETVYFVFTAVLYTPECALIIDTGDVLSPNPTKGWTSSSLTAWLTGWLFKCNNALTLWPRAGRQALAMHAFSVNLHYKIE